MYLLWANSLIKQKSHFLNTSYLGFKSSELPDKKNDPGKKCLGLFLPIMFYIWQQWFSIFFLLHAIHMYNLFSSLTVILSQRWRVGDWGAHRTLSVRAEELSRGRRHPTMPILVCPTIWPYLIGQLMRLYCMPAR